MAPPNNEPVPITTCLQPADKADETDRPSKRIRETHHVSNNSSPAAAAMASESDEAALFTCLKLLFLQLPSSLATQQSDISSFRELWTSHGFRTSLVTSPHQAVSIYLDSCRQCECNDKEEGRAFLLSCIGMHPQQKELEVIYANVKSAFCFNSFLMRLRNVRKGDMENECIRGILSSWEKEMKVILEELESNGSCLCITRLQNLANSSSLILSKLVSKLTEIDHSLRSDQLLREYNRITYENCTLTNACLQRWIYGNKSSGKPKFQLGEVYFQCSPPGSYIPTRERITIRFEDENSETTHGKLIFLPSLTKILDREDTKCHPLDRVVEDMIKTTWDDLLRNGYYVDQNRREQLSDPLKKFYWSGLLGGRESNMPILLSSHFTPTYPLSLYLHGTAGAGKSSLVRNLFPAMNAAIAIHCDPELMVRFVKQNLNKPFNTLQLELDLRPNNNDYSVMSIIQGRRMTLSQSKPGLVLVALEEMPCNIQGRDPNQLDVSKLISMRFSGRKGEFKYGDAPRNSSKRGISGDATIINVFTSNYNLEEPCLNALQRLEMFQNLHVIHMTSVSGQDRAAFALSYLTQRVDECLAPWKGEVSIHLDVPLGAGDTRPLVRYLRMLSFYIHAMVLISKLASSSDLIEVSVSNDASTNIITVANSKQDTMQLRSGSFNNIYTLSPLTLDSRASEIVQHLQKLHPDLKGPSELRQILDFYFAKTLAPAVVISNKRQVIEDLVNLLSQSKGVHGIPDINPSNYKIMKSLYDSNDTPNLRDDIIKILNGNPEALVAIQLNCETTDAQMQIREIVEDTPSMTAFSTERSALHKEGLFFGIFVDGSITPEIESRASLVI